MFGEMLDPDENIYICKDPCYQVPHVIKYRSLAVKRRRKTDNATKLADESPLTRSLVAATTPRQCVMDECVSTISGRLPGNALCIRVLIESSENDDTAESAKSAGAFESALSAVADEPT